MLRTGYHRLCYPRPLETHRAHCPSFDEEAEFAHPRACDQTHISLLERVNGDFAYRVVSIEDDPGLRCELAVAVGLRQGSSPIVELGLDGDDMLERSSGGRAKLNCFTISYHQTWQGQVTEHTQGRWAGHAGASHKGSD